MSIYASIGRVGALAAILGAGVALAPSPAPVTVDVSTPRLAVAPLEQPEHLVAEPKWVRASANTLT